MSESAEEKAIMFICRCGKKYKFRGRLSGQAFVCKQCGARLLMPNTNMEAQDRGRPDAAPSKAPHSDKKESPQIPDAKEQVSMPMRERTGRRRLWVLMGVAAVVLLAVIACLYIVQGNRKSESGSAQKAPVVDRPSVLAELVMSAFLPDDLVAQERAMESLPSQPNEVEIAQSKQTIATDSTGVLMPEKLFARASPAVVKLVVKAEGRSEIGSASGFIIELVDPEGKPAGQWELLSGKWHSRYRSTVVTNYHVIRPAVEIDVLFPSGDKGSVTAVLSEDEIADVAILEVASFNRPAYALALADGPNPAVGAKVYTIGSPLGLTNTLGEGLVSGFRDRGELERWIQISAPISPGSSGGPVLDSTGKVLGVTTVFLEGGQSLNFAIPVKELKRVWNKPAAKRRQLWAGSDLWRARCWAFWDAWSALDETIRKVHPGANVAQWKKCAHDMAMAGDQVAIIVKAREEFEKERAMDLKKALSQEISTLQQAAKVAEGKYAYLVYYVLGEAYYEEHFGNTSDADAVAALKRSEELNPDFAPAVSKLCDIYSNSHTFGNSDRDWNPELLAEAQRLVRMVPRSAEAYLVRGDAWARFGRRQESESDFASAIELRPRDAKVFEAVGLAYRFHLRDFDSAVLAFEKEIALEPEDPAGYDSLGIMYYKDMRMFDKAIPLLERAKVLHLRLSSSKDDVDGLIAQLLDEEIAYCRRCLEGR